MPKSESQENTNLEEIIYSTVIGQKKHFVGQSFLIEFFSSKTNQIFVIFH